jgi:hypothetical protein
MVLANTFRQYSLTSRARRHVWPEQRQRATFSVLAAAPDVPPKDAL